MDKNKIVSFAINFTSFLVERVDLSQVILFGSVANNNFDKESDVDIFVETNPKNEEKIFSILSLYKKSKDYEKFKLSGIGNEISIKCGHLKDWKDLERSIISNGIVLYGAYKGRPEDLKHKILFLLSLEKIDRTKKIRIWRRLYGYKQKIGAKVYTSEGIIERKIGRGAFLVPIENSQKVIDYLRENKIKYQFFDVWME